MCVLHPDAEGSASAQNALAQVSALVDALNDLGPVVTRALRSKRLMSGLTNAKTRKGRSTSGA